MKLFLLSVILFLVSFQAVRALHCMQGIEHILSNGTVIKDEENLMQNNVECEPWSAYINTEFLKQMKPETITGNGLGYMCIHLRFEDSKLKRETIFKGCIYKDKNLCDGMFHRRYSAIYCSQCDQDDCNSSRAVASSSDSEFHSTRNVALAHQYVSNWKILCLTLLLLRVPGS